MSESVRDRWLSIGMSVLLHGTLIVLLAIGVWHFRHPAPTPPIDATVVDARTLKGLGTASIPSPKPKPAVARSPSVPPSEGPPLPTPDEQAMREQAAKAEAQHEALAQQELLARQQAKAQREAQEAAAAAQAAQAQEVAQAQAVARARKLAEAQERAEARKKAEAAKLAAQKKLARERKLAEEKKLAAQQKLAAQRAAAARAARVAELQQSLQEDAQATAASGALASWTSEISSRIENAWIKPSTARPGIECILNVSVIPGGTVTGVSIGRCNGDDAVRQSIQTAVYNASPLPPPPNGVPFPSQLSIDFKPSN